MATNDMQIICIVYYYTDKEEAGCSCTLEDILVFFLVLKGYPLWVW